MNSSDHFLPVLLRRYVMTWTHHVERFTQAVYGFEMPESRLLWLIHLSGPITASRLVEPAFMRKFQVSRSLAKLRRLGLISATPHPEDQRSEVIALTRKGSACAQQLTELSNKWADATESDLSLAEHRQLMALVGKLQAGVERLGAEVDADLSACLPDPAAGSIRPRRAKARDLRQPGRMRLR